ncbi:MAG: hydantoinase/oxoprolinase family protein [Solirubrobacteraceae bacterium]
MPEAFVSLSCVVLPEYREYERAMTTILDVLVKPFTRDYLARADAGLVETVGRVPFLIMQSNGGVVSASEVGAKPITTLVSGPAAGVLAAAFIGERAGYRSSSRSTPAAPLRRRVPDRGPHAAASSTRRESTPTRSRRRMLDIVAVGTGGGSISPWRRTALAEGGTAQREAGQPDLLRARRRRAD